MAKKRQTQQKPKEVLELEEYYGIELFEEGNVGQLDNFYEVDDSGQLIGLSIRSISVPDLIPISKLSNLYRLHVQFNSLVDLSPLAECTQLQQVGIASDNPDQLSWTQVRFVSVLSIFSGSRQPAFDLRCLQELENLSSLTIQDMDVQGLGQLKHFANLQFLVFNSVNSSEWNDLNDLKYLHFLQFVDCPLDDLNFFNINMQKLSRLRMMSCGITDVSPIANCQDLLSLDLSFNKVEDITPIKNLMLLSELDLHGNKVCDISPLVGLIHLHTVNLVDNKVQRIPESLARKFERVSVEHYWAYGLNIKNNPIIEPPMFVVEQGRNEILNWFEEQKKGIRPLNEVRVMLIGHGSAGKTSLMHRLTHDGYSDNEETTHGINLETWLVKDDERTVKVNLWDFGGQQMQHSVHKFFLSNACLYVLVADNRKEDDPQYWLEHIRTLAKDAQVLVVYNKTDQNPDEVLGRKTLQDRYPNIIGFHNVSCRTGYGLQDLRSTLESLVLNSESAGKQYPLSWFNVKQQLEAATGDGRHHISYRAYEVICEEQGITDPTAQRSLLGVLSAIGTISFFDDADLDRLQILNPEWVTEGVYRIVTDDRVGKRRGDITSNDLPSLLRPKVEGDFEYKKEHYPFLLALMKKFEVCQVRDDGHILIPARFSLEPKANYTDYRGKDARLYFLFYKSFLPLSIIHRFITRHLNYAINEDYWYRGIVIKDPTSNTEAFVELNESERRIYLWLKGDDIIGYWGYLRRELQGLSDFFSGIEYDEYVAIDEENRGKLWVKYSNLRRTLNRGLATYYDPSLDKDIDVIKYLSIFDGNKILNDYRKGFRKGQLQSAMDNLNVNISPQFHMSQSQHQETRVDVKVQQISDDIIGKLSVLMQENGDVVAQNRLRQVKEATEALEREADPRNAKRSGMLDRYAHFLHQLKQGGEWVNTINDASKNLPQLTQRMSNLLEHFQSLLA